MELTTAIGLIRDGVTQEMGQQRWADLGAGNGLFTSALASLLPAGSIVSAIDSNAGAMSNISMTSEEVMIKKLVKDFVTDDLGIDSLDGIIIANALHFVREKIPFINKLKRSLKTSGKIIVVEYERTKANTWVPYPIDFTSLQKLCKTTGIQSVVRIAEAPSRYDSGGMYSALLTV